MTGSTVPGGNLVILDLIPNNRGWQPIKHVIAMLSRLFEAEVIAPGESSSVFSSLAYRFLRRRHVAGAPQLLVVASKGANLARLQKSPGWRTRYSNAAVWIVDSFWTEDSAAFEGLRHFDQVFLTWGGDMEAYRTATSAPVTWLPWGTDALRFGHLAQERPCDLMRFGRQPNAWDDDDENVRRFAEAGLAFRGRPPGEATNETYRALMSDHLATAKFVLAHSNLVDEAGFTHPTKEYLTARWTDAFACGAVVVGVQPKADPLYREIESDAVVDLASADRAPEFDRIVSEIRAWGPERAEAVHRMALRKFDWRWRLRDLGQAMTLPMSRLEDELAEIEARLA